ncbi:serine/threonine-protein kinase [Actinopolyspora halophila]|uniref:serine/threonine-protein kinase n=1 Tax=Actinopolyspora halophila TaxID=1850 RepID=UPI0003815D77|nr:serine/threonine-protein kinase [Actinopolyspora halophila]
MAKQTVIDDRYELQPAPLGRGGMGEVWAGRDTKLDREVAVKFVRFPEGSTDEELVRRFGRESRITARLQHPGVPTIFDVGTHQERPYLVMQRVHGISVSDLISENGRLPLGWAVAIAAQTCSVLTAAHQAQLVHRDLKPGNLMLEQDGTVKVLDFGLAVALDVADISRVTRTGQAIGTPAYMAPEQILSATSSARSDLYALGCVLYEMLTGQHVFSGSTDYLMMNKQVDERPLPARRHRSEIPAGLDALVIALLDKEPDNRPDSAHAVYDRLLPFAADLEMLPGALADPATPSPTRMYASVLSQVFRPGRSPEDSGEQEASTERTNVPEAGGSEAETSQADVSRTSNPEEAAASAVARAESAAASRSGRGGMTREEMEQIKIRATSYVKQSRHGQAAELLRAAVDSGSRAFGSTDSEVINLRLEWANVLFEGGEYSRAEPVYRALATDLAQRDGPDAELVFRCRLHNATCHALGGHTSRALRAMDSLLSDEQRAFGPDDPRTLELRRQIGLLQQGAGRHEDAGATLAALLEDLVRVHGTEHPTAAKVRELLDELPGHKR